MRFNGRMCDVTTKPTHLCDPGALGERMDWPAINRIQAEIAQRTVTFEVSALRRCDRKTQPFDPLRACAVSWRS